MEGMPAGRCSAGENLRSRITDRRDREELTVMRRQLVTLTLAGLAIATTTTGSSSAASDEPSVTAAPTVAVHRVNPGGPAIRDEATMVLVGAVLIGLGAVVRRA